MGGKPPGVAPIGAAPGYPFEEVTFTLEAGDSVALFTDGVTSVMNPAGVCFGPEAVDHNLAPDDVLSAVSQHPRGMGRRLVEALRIHANGRSQNDDIAFVYFGRCDCDSLLGSPHPASGELLNRS